VRPFPSAGNRARGPSSFLTTQGAYERLVRTQNHEATLVTAGPGPAISKALDATLCVAAGNCAARGAHQSTLVPSKTFRIGLCQTELRPAPADSCRYGAREIRRWCRSVTASSAKEERGAHLESPHSFRERRRRSKGLHALISVRPRADSTSSFTFAERAARPSSGSLSANRNPSRLRSAASQIRISPRPPSRLTMCTNTRGFVANESNGRATCNSKGTATAPPH